jgi:hypothetical protein
MTWEDSKSLNKSASETDRIAHLLGNSDIDADELKRDLASFSHSREVTRLDRYMSDPTTALSERNGWKCTNISIPLPCDGVKVRESAAERLAIDGVYVQDPIELIVSRYSTCRHFHYTPFELLWTPGPGEPSQRIRSNIFSSKAMLEADSEVQNIKLNPNEDDVERVVAPIIFASDSTHLAQFGDASLWPVYQMYGAEDQYIRSMPTVGSCDHIAYVPSVSSIFSCLLNDVILTYSCVCKIPKDFQEKYFKAHGKQATAETIAFCKREIMHAIWHVLLSGPFEDAYKNGIVVTCADNVRRRIFPRILHYSADYPEK